jgi:uncharacterized protein YjlB
MARAREAAITHRLADDGTYPNSRLPLIVYPGTLPVSDPDPARLVETAFEANGWAGSWRNGIYPYHHFHTTAHEVLGVYGGTAELQLGGPNGVTLQLHSGDVVIIPAGVAHKNLGQSPDFAVVGAYPDGQRWDMNYGRPGERPAADERIARVALPRMDPVYGADGPLMLLWRQVSKAGP